MKNLSMLSFLAVFLGLFLLGLAPYFEAGWRSPLSVVHAHLSPSPTPSPMPSESWLILPDLPDSATQADYGAEIYRLVCQDCHGDRGQGLTVEWRSQWAPKDRNCWQSRCHASNHPVDGFDLPHYVPGIIGPAHLARFETALDLYNYISTDMPWHDPGSLLPEEYMQLTAFLVRESGLDPIETPLEPLRASAIRLHPDQPILSTPPAIETNEETLPYPLWVIAITFLTIGILVVILWRARDRDK